MWLEYEQGTSIEADLARQLDKFEMIVQANEYEIAQPGKRLERFFETTKDSFTHPEVTPNNVRGPKVIYFNKIKHPFLCR